jgi:hypothetical protein
VAGAATAAVLAVEALSGSVAAAQTPAADAYVREEQDDEHDCENGVKH